MRNAEFVCVTRKHTCGKLRNEKPPEVTSTEIKSRFISEIILKSWGRESNWQLSEIVSVLSYQTKYSIFLNRISITAVRHTSTPILLHITIAWSYNSLWKPLRSWCRNRKGNIILRNGRFHITYFLSQRAFIGEKNLIFKVQIQAPSRNNFFRRKVVSNTYSECICVCLIYQTCKAHAPYCHLLHVRLYHNFPHYLIKGTIFGQTLFNMKRVCWFSLQICLKYF
jgi:hypothetical protein